MKKIVLLYCFFFYAACWSQDSQMAATYFEKGEFDKAVVLLENLYKQQPYDQLYFNQLVTCYQQLKQFDQAETLILQRIDRFKYASLYVVLGYNYQLQNNNEKATIYYQKAIDSLTDMPNMVHATAKEFENKALIKQAIQSYEYAKTLNPDRDFSYPLALLYGQNADFEKMIDSLFSYADLYQNDVAAVQNLLSFYMNDDATQNFSNQLRRSLLQRVQKKQDIFWVHFLSWYFVQQHDYGKAFVQEKAIFLREATNIPQLFSLATAAQNAQDYTTALEILDFITQNQMDQEVQLQAAFLENKIALATNQPNQYNQLKEKFDQQLAHFGISANTVDLTLQIATFYGFELENFNQAKLKIDKLLALSLPSFQQAKVKSILADLYLANQKYNQAIVYYGQVQDLAKNSELAHDAQYKMALTNYFKGDFDWAQKQFKALKQATSQLVANDALEMFLLINDANQQDSTKVVLSALAKADFLKFSVKNEQAQKAYQQILTSTNSNAMHDVILYRLAQIDVATNKSADAVVSLERLLSEHPESIYRDDAFFLLGLAYEKLQQPEKAQYNFEQLILNHPDSIYFLEAQTKYRKNRGD